jgi:hypothetical protein
MAVSVHRRQEEVESVLWPREPDIAMSRFIGRRSMCSPGKAKNIGKHQQRRSDSITRSGFQSVASFSCCISGILFTGGCNDE